VERKGGDCWELLMRAFYWGEGRGGEGKKVGERHEQEYTLMKNLSYWHWHHVHAHHHRTVFLARRHPHP
jgi:hypothetical protein